MSSFADKKSAELTESACSRCFFLFVVLLPPLIALTGAVSHYFGTEMVQWVWPTTHNLLEIFGACAAFSCGILLIFLLADQEQSSLHIWIGFSLFVSGFLDILHASVSSGPLFVWLHTLSVFLGGLLLLPIIFSKTEQSIFSSRRTLLVLTIMLLLGVFSLIYHNFFPAMLVDKEFSTFAAVMNAIGGLGYLLLALHFSKSSDPMIKMLFYFFLLSAWGGLFFFFSTLWSPVWWFWHFLRLSAGIMLLNFVIRSFSHIRKKTKANMEELFQSNLSFEHASLELKATNAKLDSANAHLQSNLASLEEFAYIVAHDLKTPLRGLTSLSEILLADYAKELDTTGKQHLERLLERTQLMSEMIDGILQIARVGRMSAHKETVNVGVLVDEVIRFLSPPPPPHIRIERGELDQVELCQNCELLRQIFQNLIDNAIKYGATENALIQISQRREGDCWLFWVRDNGLGIEARHHERIFKMFQTLQTKRVKSTGIGLPIVHKAIECMGGRIWIESALGQGTTFYFTLPAQ